MTKTESLAFLTEAEAKRLMSRGNPVQCERVGCRKLIEIDKPFVRKRRRNAKGLHTDYYCVDCWNEMFYEEQTE